jgi:hypothetical protein
LYNTKALEISISYKGGHEVMIALERQKNQQIPLIHIVHEDDTILLNTKDAEWFKILYHFPWREYRQYAAAYYDALYEFNMREQQEGEVARGDGKAETVEEARQRLLFDRVTMQAGEGKKRPVLYEVKEEDKPVNVKPEDIFPGKVPERLGGKKPKCFFALMKSFIGTTLMGFACEPENVHLLLTSNPNFVRVCGFTPKREKDEYCAEHIPGLRKLEQFDQIMRDSGLWNKIKVEEVRGNIANGVIEKEEELVGDTTHYHAYSGFEVVRYEDEDAKEQKKSQSKPTKRCRCKDRQTCKHPWELADDGAGTIVKSTTKMYWGHKASVLGYPRQGVPLDARAVQDAATNDGETFYPHVKSLFKTYPEIKGSVKRVLYDSACDSKGLKEKFRQELGVELKTSLNPRRKREITEDLPRGIERITPYGVPVCWNRHEMEYKGMRYENEKFIYQAPRDEEKKPVCVSCPYKAGCCPNAFKGRTITVSFDQLPHIDPNDPPMAKRYKAIMSLRPSVERIIKRLKCDLGDDRLSKRGNDSFQAYLDKTMIAFHIIIRN